MGLNGTEDLLNVVSQFLSDRVAQVLIFFSCLIPSHLPSQPVRINPGNIRLVNGVSAGLEVMSWILADPGEVVLVPVPTYAR